MKSGNCMLPRSNKSLPSGFTEEVEDYCGLVSRERYCVQCKARVQLYFSKYLIFSPMEHIIALL
jgi:hypothetical protein